MDHLQEVREASERRACKVSGQHRSTQRYRSKTRDDEARLVADMHRLVLKNPRRGCRHITELLKREGWHINYKRVHRLWKKEGFKVPKKRRKNRAVGDSANACDKRAATEKNDVWAWDFIHDRTVDGRQLKCLGIIDEYTRECLSLEMARSFSADEVLDVLGAVMGARGIPNHIRSDNGPEFIAKKMKGWLEKAGVETLYIEPGAPWQNGYAESFNSRFRDEFLETNYFHTLNEARQMTLAWKDKYNTKRPHTSLKNMTPSEFAVFCGDAAPVSLRSTPPASPQKTVAA